MKKEHPAVGNTNELLTVGTTLVPHPLRFFFARFFFLPDFCPRPGRDVGLPLEISWPDSAIFQTRFNPRLFEREKVVVESVPHDGRPWRFSQRCACFSDGLGLSDLTFFQKQGDSLHALNYSTCMPVCAKHFKRC